MRVLLVEDDEVLGSAIHDEISSGGNGVDWVRSLADAGSSLDTAAYELILLDLNLPDGRGLGFLQNLRASKIKVPVIIITAQDQITVRIEGLNSGADDYLVKPFNLREMTAGVSAVARRSAGEHNPVRQIEDVTIDLARRSITVGARAETLTAREWALLERLLRRPGTIVPKAELEDSLYAFGAEVESNALEVHVSRIRKKLGRDFIQTMRGVGYRITS